MITYTIEPSDGFFVSIDGRAPRFVELPLGTHTEDELNAFVGRETGGMVGVEVEADRVARRGRERAARLELIREYRAECRPQRPGRQVVRCEECRRRYPARRGIVPWSEEAGRKRAQWMCFACWLSWSNDPPECWD